MKEGGTKYDIVDCKNEEDHCLPRKQMIGIEQFLKNSIYEEMEHSRFFSRILNANFQII